MLQNRLFPALASRSGCGAAISDAVVSADRIIVAASRLLGAAAACVILLSFAAEDRKSYWNVCIKAAKVICQQILALAIFLLKVFFKNAAESSFYRCGVELRFWRCNFRRCCALCVLQLSLWSLFSIDV